jgi:hypothetical protein
MDTETTQPGVTDEQVDATQEAPTPETALLVGAAQRRMAMMDEIGARRTEALSEELGVEIARDEAPPAHVDQVSQQLADDDGFIDPAAMGRKAKLTVDGEERVVTLEQLVREAQKSGAADRRLAAATEMLRQAQAAQAAAPRETAGTIAPSVTQDPSDNPTVKAKLKDALGAIFSGDEDAATEAFAQVFASGSQREPVADPDALVEAVTQRIDERSALEGFFGAYPRIAQNTYLQQAADDALSHFRTAGHDYRTALKMAGDAVYQQFGYQRDAQAAPSSPVPTTDRLATVNARKATLDVPAGRTMSAAQSQAAVESSEQSRGQTIADIAAARRRTMTPARG